MGNLIFGALGFIASLILSQDTLDEIGSIVEVTIESLGFSERSLAVDGTERVFFEFTSVESSANDDAPHPLIIILHGTFGGPPGLFTPGVVFSTGILAEVGTRGGTIIAPQGTPLSFFGLFDLPLLSSRFVWNDHGKSWLRPDVDDVAFVERLVEWGIDERNVDPSRVFLTGVSGGGSLVYRILNERSYLFAAAAPLISSLWPIDAVVPTFDTYTPLPILSVHATEDPFFAFTGGTTLLFDSRSVDETLDYFANLNGLSETDKTVMNLPDDDPSDECSAQMISITSPNVPPVEAYIVEGGGHTVPGTIFYIFYKPIHPLVFGNVCNEAFDFSPILIDFFDRYGF